MLFLREDPEFHFLSLNEALSAVELLLKILWCNHPETEIIYIQFYAKPKGLGEGLAVRAKENLVENPVLCVRLYV